MAELLLRRIKELGSLAHPSLMATVAPALEAPRVVDASMPLRYFFEGTPEEAAFSERELPVARPPGEKPLFVEGRMPASSDGGAVGFLMYKLRGRAAEVFDPPPGTAEVVLLALFYEEEDAEGPVGPEIVWGVPLTECGRTHPSTVRSDVGVNAAVVPPPGVAAPQGYVQRVILARNVLMQAAMFCVFCLRCAETGWATLERSRARGPGTGYRWERLDTRRLEDRLNGAGGGADFGLAHALSAVGGELWPAGRGG